MFDGAACYLFFSSHQSPYRHVLKGCVVGPERRRRRGYLGLSRSSRDSAAFNEQAERWWSLLQVKRSARCEKKGRREEEEEEEEARGVGEQERETVVAAASGCGLRRGVEQWR